MAGSGEALRERVAEAILSEGRALGFLDEPNLEALDALQADNADAFQIGEEALALMSTSKIDRSLTPPGGRALRSPFSSRSETTSLLRQPRLASEWSLRPRRCPESN